MRYLVLKEVSWWAIALGALFLGFSTLAGCASEKVCVPKQDLVQILNMCTTHQEEAKELEELREWKEQMFF